MGSHGNAEISRASLAAVWRRVLVPIDAPPPKFISSRKHAPSRSRVTSESRCTTSRLAPVGARRHSPARRVGGSRRARVGPRASFAMRGGFALALRALALSSLVVLAGGDVTYTRLTDGVDTPRTSPRWTRRCTSTSTFPRTDAVLTLDVLDGDADLYVLGPTIPATTGVLPTSYRTWQHPRAPAGRHRVHIEPRGVGEVRHRRHLPRGRLGLVLRGRRRRRRLEWTLRVDLVPKWRSCTARGGGSGVYDACCGDDGSCAAWNLAGDEPRTRVTFAACSATPPATYDTSAWSTSDYAVTGAPSSPRSRRCSRRRNASSSETTRTFASRPGRGTARRSSRHSTSPRRRSPTFVSGSPVFDGGGGRRDVFSIGVRGDPPRVGLPAPIQLGPSRTRA